MKKITAETINTAFAAINVIRDIVRGDKAPRRHHGRHDEFGRELVDSRPMEPPVGYEPSPSIAEMIQRMVQSERIKAELMAAGAETFEEADDFDVGDDYDPQSPYEERFYSEAPLPQLAAAELSSAHAPNDSGGTGGLPPVRSDAAAPADEKTAVQRAIDALTSVLPAKS